MVELSKHFKKPHCQGTSSAVQIDISMLYVILQDDAGFEVLLVPRPVNVQLSIAVPGVLLFVQLLESSSCVADQPF